MRDIFLEMIIHRGKFSQSKGGIRWNPRIIGWGRLCKCECLIINCFPKTSLKKIEIFLKVEHFFKLAISREFFSKWVILAENWNFFTKKVIIISKRTFVNTVNKHLLKVSLIYRVKSWVNAWVLLVGTVARLTSLGREKFILTIVV